MPLPELSLEPDGLWSAVLAEQPRAQRLARARCSTWQDAEDVVQEAMLRVATMRGVDLTRIGSLLSTVVANLAADSHRTRARAARAAPRLAIAIQDSSPEEQLCDLEEARWLWRSMHALPSQDRAVLELRARGLTVSEVAAELGVSYKAAESSYTRARSRLRSIWKATAALIAILWGRPARQPRSGSALVIAASAAAVALAFLPAAPGNGGEVELPFAAPGVGSQRTAEPATPQANPTERHATVGKTPGRAATAVRVRSPEAEAPVLESAPLRTGVIEGGDTRLVREHDEESFEQTVERCLVKGLHLSLTRVECRD